MTPTTIATAPAASPARAGVFPVSDRVAPSMSSTSGVSTITAASPNQMMLRRAITALTARSAERDLVVQRRPSCRT